MVIENIGVDLDETTFDFFSPIFQVYFKKTGKIITRKDITSYKAPIVPNIPREEVWLKPGFFRNLKPFPFAVDVLQRLSKRCVIMIATDALGIDFIKEEKLETIKKYLPFVDLKHVIFGSEKHKIGIDLLFDDAPQHLEQFPKYTVKMVREYNRHVPTNAEIHNTDWLAFERLCDNLLK